MDMAAVAMILIALLFPVALWACFVREASCALRERRERMEFDAEMSAPAETRTDWRDVLRDETERTMSGLADAMPGCSVYMGRGGSIMADGADGRFLGCVRVSSYEPGTASVARDRDRACMEFNTDANGIRRIAEFLEG